MTSGNENPLTYIDNIMVDDRNYTPTLPNEQYLFNNRMGLNFSQQMSTLGIKLWLYLPSTDTYTLGAFQHPLNLDGEFIIDFDSGEIFSDDHRLPLYNTKIEYFDPEFSNWGNLIVDFIDIKDNVVAVRFVDFTQI